jgi:hypothetical protein
VQPLGPEIIGVTSTDGLPAWVGQVISVTVTPFISVERGGRMGRRCA